MLFIPLRLLFVKPDNLGDIVRTPVRVLESIPGLVHQPVARERIDNDFPANRLAAPARRFRSALAQL